MKRFNSGGSLTRPHFFMAAKNYKGDECHVVCVVVLFEFVVLSNPQRWYCLTHNGGTV